MNERETCWLIERSQPEGQAPTVWFSGDGLHLEWTEDATKAKRFPYQAAAEGEANRLFARYDGDQKRNCHVTEHIFLARPEEGTSALEWECQQGDKICAAAGVERTEGGSLNPAKIINALRRQGLEQVENALRRNPRIAMFLDQGFWHAHHVDIVIRYNGKDERYEADWITDLWRIVIRNGMTATEAVRAEQASSGNAGGALTASAPQPRGE